MENSWTFTSEIDINQSLKLHYVVVPRAILLEMNKGEEKGMFSQRVKISIPKVPGWQGGIVAIGDGNGYITVSQARLKKAKLEKGMETQVNLELDNSEYGFEMPEELEAIFAVDQEIHKKFESLKMGMKRYIIYYILQVKSSEKREARALLLLNNLRTSDAKSVTFRMLLGKE